MAQGIQFVLLFIAFFEETCAVDDGMALRMRRYAWAISHHEDLPTVSNALNAWKQLVWRGIAITIAITAAIAIAFAIIITVTIPSPTPSDERMGRSA